jgi:hypothetical protein
LGFVNTISETTLHEVPTFLYASSSSVYGDFSKIPYKEDEVNLLPNSFYGATKLCNEIIAPTIIKNSSTVARGVRLFTVYGPWGRPDMAYFRICASAVSDVSFTLFGDGKIERDFTYIDDVVNCCINLSNELANRNMGYSDIVNIGGGKPISMNSAIEKIMLIANKKFDYEITSSNKNDVANYTNWWNFPQQPFKAVSTGPSSGTLQTARQDQIIRHLRILMDGNEIQEEKGTDYFTKIVAGRNQRGGSILPQTNYIPTFSFQLENNALQPSGSVNASRIRNFQVEVDVFPLPVNTTYTYDVTIYVENINFFEVVSGMGGLKYAL